MGIVFHLTKATKTLFFLSNFNITQKTHIHTFHMRRSLYLYRMFQYLKCEGGYRAHEKAEDRRIIFIYQ